MKRTITADEVRSFFESCIKQFDEAGFYLHSVRIHRSESQNTPQITLNYSQDEELHRTDPKNPTERAKQALSA